MSFSEDMEISILHTDIIFEHEQIESNESSIRIIGLFHPHKLNGFYTLSSWTFKRRTNQSSTPDAYIFNLGFQVYALNQVKEPLVSFRKQHI